MVPACGTSSPDVGAAGTMVSLPLERQALRAHPGQGHRDLISGASKVDGAVGREHPEEWAALQGIVAAKKPAWELLDSGKDARRRYKEYLATRGAQSKPWLRIRILCTDGDLEHKHSADYPRLHVSLTQLAQEWSVAQP